MQLSYLKTSLLHLILLAITTSETNATRELCHPHDKRALLRIKQQSFNKSILFNSWDSTTDCCTVWSNVQCDEATNRVVTLTILDSDTKGTPFPTALGDLPYLVSVDFHNEATGPIPDSLANLRHIETFILSFNRLTGPIPTFFNHLTKLNYLDLSNNKLSGLIPVTLVLPSSLTNLDLSNNRLTGHIPRNFVKFLRNGNIDLALSNNELSGKIPRTFTEVKFYRFDVSGNKLKGDPTSVLFRTDNMAHIIDLSGNSFSFNMTNLEIPAMMNVLDISRNRIYGNLPAVFPSLPNLQGLNVSYNRLCGPIPTGGNMDLFHQTSYFHNKCLCGTPLPPEKVITHLL